MTTSPQSICGVILVTDDVERLRAFYEDVLGFGLEKEEHGDLPVHYGVDIGSTHLGIHPPQSFGRNAARPGGSVFAIEVEAIDPLLERLSNYGYQPAIPKHDEGFGPVVAIEDPDGNLIELVELTYDFEKERA